MSEWMQYALSEAQAAATEGEIPVGAVIVRNGEVIASAHNRREADADPTGHAEILCIREAAKKLGNWRLSDCTMYVTLEPCPMCAGALLASRVSRCVFGARDDALGCCGSVYDLPADPRLGGSMLWESGDSAEESKTLLTSFFQEKRNAKEEQA